MNQTNEVAGLLNMLQQFIQQRHHSLTCLRLPCPLMPQGEKGEQGRKDQRLQRARANFSGADPDRPFQIIDENLAVTNLAGVGG